MLNRTRNKFLWLKVNFPFQYKYAPHGTGFEFFDASCFRPTPIPIWIYSATRNQRHRTTTTNPNTEDPAQQLPRSDSNPIILSLTRNPCPYFTPTRPFIRQRRHRFPADIFRREREPSWLRVLGFLTQTRLIRRLRRLVRRFSLLSRCFHLFLFVLLPNYGSSLFGCSENNGKQKNVMFFHYYRIDSFLVC